MVRIDGWPIRLSLFLRARRRMPHSWGDNDCVMFAADAVKAVTGEDLAAKYRGSYSTQEQAAELVNQLGGMIKIISDALGSRGHRNILAARRGDIAIVKMPKPTGIVAGVVDDTGMRIAFPTADDNKLCRMPIKNAWRIWGY